MQEFNAGFRLLENAATYPDHIAMKTEEIEVSYSQLRNLVVCFALHLQEYNIEYRSTVGIQTNDPLVLMASIFASALVGCRWAYTNPTLVKFHKIEITHFLQTSDIETPAVENPVVIDGTWAKPPATIDLSGGINFSGFAARDAAWILTQTSGTTGTPKFMEISFENAFWRAVEKDDDFVPSQTVFTSLFPIAAFPYINRLLTCLLNNCTVIQSNNPNFWIRSGVNLVMGSPNQVQDVLGSASISEKIKMLHVGGAVLSDRLALNLLKNFEEVVDLYGSRESNRTYKHTRKLDPDGFVVSKGKVLNAEIEFVNSDDLPVPNGEIGIVRIRNKHLVSGYLNSPAAQATAFKGGWFYPGDLGRWNDHGILEITGRVNDLINIGGVKVNAAKIDAAILSVPNITDAISFLLPTESGVGVLAAFVSVSNGANKEKCETLARISCGGVESQPKRFFYLDQLPRNEGGKPDRKACAALALKFTSSEFSNQ